MTSYKQLQILLLPGPEERNYLLAFKKLLNEIPEARSANVTVTFQHFSTKTELDQASKRFDYVVVARPEEVKIIAPPQVSFASAAGSFYESRFLILPPLDQLYTVRHGAWLMKRYLGKIFTPSKFIKFPKFQWQRVRTNDEFEECLRTCERARLIAADIETTRASLGISCMGFAALTSDGKIKVYVLDCRDENYLRRLQLLCQTSTPKIFQNGLYDIQYLIRWNIDVRNWAGDTAYFLHAWYSELPKNLGFIGSLFLLNFEYWKHEGNSWTEGGGQIGAAGLEEFWRYNAKDCYATLCSFIAMIGEAPQWAKENFYTNFPRFFPAVFCSLHGIKASLKNLELLRSSAETKLLQYESSLRKMVALGTFNAGSPKQVKKLLSLFGLGDYDTDEKTLVKLGAKHPLLDRILRQVILVREQKKALSTYFVPDKLLGTNGEERILYNLNPAGTDTSRMASQESVFWCGLQLQNVPDYAKGYFEAEEGFELGEVDNEQSETRCTAYLAQDTNLISVVEDKDKDFHTFNAAQFFGENYNHLRNEVKRLKELGKTHPLRELAKRINHAISYNMGPQVFVDTVGPAKMEEIRTILKLSRTLSHKDIAQYLINLFDRQYPRVRNEFQKEVIKEISFTGRIRSPTGWTRYFFANPQSSKHALNSAVAHGPQCLSVQIVNDGFLRVFRNIQLHPEHCMNFRLLGQIHDSILFGTKLGMFEKYSKMVQDNMHQEVMVHGRKLVIPTAVKHLGQFWSKTGLEDIDLRQLTPAT